MTRESDTGRSVTQQFESASRLAIASTYTHRDLERRSFDPVVDLGLPGQYPYTRGVTPEMYREELWVMGQYSGYGSAKATNRRIRSLLEQGQRGFSIALDLPTQMGLDSDDPLAVFEVGKVGVPIDALPDMVELLDGIALDHVRQIRTTANAIGPIAVALFVAAAEELGYSPDQFRVMLQNDVLKEYVARGTYIFPPRFGMEFSVDVIEYCTRNLPHWESIEFCGYHIRDSGASAIQEVAFALAHGLDYIDATLKRGVEIQQFIGSVWLFLSAGIDLFEEVAKFRAARRLWARTLRDRYGVSDEDAKGRIFCYTLGSLQTAQEPLNNIVRVAYQSLAAVLGGVQTLATTAYDEAVQLPSEESVRVALRTQQILAYETGATRTVDPLGGSYFVEDMTTRVEEAIVGYLGEIERLGGGVEALISGWTASQIDKEAYLQQLEIEAGKRPVVGVNRFRAEEQSPIRSRLVVDDDAAASQIERLERIRSERSASRVAECLSAVSDSAAGGRNTIPAILAAIRAHVTIGEITSALREIWGSASDRAASEAPTSSR